MNAALTSRRGGFSVEVELRGQPDVIVFGDPALPGAFVFVREMTSAKPRESVTVYGYTYREAIVQTVRNGEQIATDLPHSTVNTDLP